MKIRLSQIDANPHRDLTRNPVSEEQIVKLVESINRTGFWDNLVLRPHPDQPDRYQLAYGHNRLAACQRVNIEEVDLPVRDLTDYDMLCCMIDENNTQQQITPKIVFENVTAAIELAERLLRQTENVDQFNELLKNSMCTGLYTSKKWCAQVYSQAKSAIAEDGDGLGRGFIEQFMPSPPHPNTLQNALDSHYEERRKAAAERRKAIAEEEQRKAEAERAEREAAARQAAADAEAARQAKAEADRLEREANERIFAAKQAQQEKERKAAEDARDAQRKAQRTARQQAEQAEKAAQDHQKAADKAAKKAKEHAATVQRETEKSARQDYAGVNRDLLESLHSTTKMNDVVELIKKFKIPKEHHKDLIEAAQGWSPNGPATERAGTAISIKGADWWDKRSGNLDRRTQEELNEKLRRRFGTSAFHTVPFEILDKVKSAHSAAQKDLNRCREYFPTLTPQQAEKLVKLMTAIKENYIEWTDVIIGDLLMISQPQEKDITPVVKPLNALEYNQA